MQKCSLCGGKVVNGRCEECGMPIPPENRYTLRSETVHTHEVNGEKVLHRVRQTPGGKPAYNRPPERRAPARPQRPAQNDFRRLGNAPRKKSAPNLVWGIIVLVFLFNVMSALVTSCSA